MVRVTVYIISTDNKILKGINTGYLREPPHTSTIRSAKATKEDAMYEFYEAIENEEERLGTGVSSIYASVTPSNTPGFKWSAIFRKVNVQNTIPRVLTGEIEGADTPLQTAVREFGEELGSVINNNFFIQSPENANVFFVKVDAAAKDVIITNHSDLEPFTEMIKIGWVENTENLVPPAGAPTVTAGDITKHPDAVIATNVRKTFQNLERVSRSSAKSVLNGGKTIRWRKLKRSKRKGTLKRGVRR